MAVECAVQGLKTRPSQSYARVSFVQPVFEVAHLHPCTSNSSGSHRVLKLPVALNMTSGGSALLIRTQWLSPIPVSPDVPFAAFFPCPLPFPLISLIARHRVD